MSKCAENSSFPRKWNFRYDTSDGGGQGGVFQGPSRIAPLSA